VPAKSKTSPAPQTRRAAQYLRMSTEHQEFSTANQRDAIGAFAVAKGFKIVATYEDAGKSGLTLSGRPSLRKLIADVVAGQDVFDTILVYDVSRWGRFQDADESAHLEYMCRLAGVHVEYCAEPFSNDGTPYANIFKVVKRTLAAEYSRELSEKVYAGKRRLVTLGFRQGGSPGYGLRRCLVDQSRNRKGVLPRGVNKSIATDRIILVPGPAAEVAIVRRMYRDYADRGLSMAAITVGLNRKGIPSESGRHWSEAVVKRVLTSEKYVGDSVWGQQSFKLQVKRRNNAPETWARYDGAFEGIISRSLFEKAQKARATRARRVTEDDVIAMLRQIKHKHGVITTRLINETGLLKTNSLRKRYGSLIRVYAQVGFSPARDLAFLSIDGAARRLRDTTATAIIEGVEARGGTIERLKYRCAFLINGEFKVSVIVAQQRTSYHRSPRWHVKMGGSGDDLTIAALMDGPHERPLSYFFVPASEIGQGLILAPRNPIDVEVFRSKDLEPILRLCQRCEAGSEEASSQPIRSCNGQKANTQQPPPLVRIKMNRRWSRSVKKKSYTGAFLRASVNMRTAIARANAVQTRLDMLREALAGLLNNARFVRLLASQGMSTLPKSAFLNEEVLRKQEHDFQAELRKRALALLADKSMTADARSLFDKLKAKRRLEVAECVVMVNDCTEYYVRSLVAATPPSGLAEWPRKHVYGARQNELKMLIDEGDANYRETKRALSTFALNALDLMAVVAFSRRMLTNAGIIEWLKRYDSSARGAFSARSVG
jgi:DNA invertase Pin-like site-specific DNA recombinase